MVQGGIGRIREERRVRAGGWLSVAWCPRGWLVVVPWSRLHGRWVEGSAGHVRLPRRPALRHHVRRVISRLWRWLSAEARRRRSAGIAWAGIPGRRRAIARRRLPVARSRGHSRTRGSGAGWDHARREGPIGWGAWDFKTAGGFRRDRDGWRGKRDALIGMIIPGLVCESAKKKWVNSG